jgi:hypothetical protein
MSSINDLISAETATTDQSMGTVDTDSRLSYQDAMSQVRPLDMLYFKKKLSSDSSSESYSSKYSHAGIIVNSELLPSVSGLKTGRYYVLQASNSGDPNTNGTVVPAPDGSSDPTDSSQNTQTKYYGVHLTDLGTVLKRYTNTDSSSGVAWAKLKNNPYVQGANETSSKYKKRKKTIVTQTDQFYQKSKPRTLGRKLFGMVHKSNKRPDGLKFSDLNLQTGSTYNHTALSWSTDPVQQYYQHMGWLKVPGPTEDSGADETATTPVVTATSAPSDVAPTTSSTDVNWAAPESSGTSADPTNSSGAPGTSLTIDTDPSGVPTTTDAVSSTDSNPPATGTTANTSSSPDTPNNPSAAPASGLTVNTSGSSPPTPTNAATSSAAPATDSGSSPTTPANMASSASSGTLDNLNSIVEDPTEMYLAPTDTIDDSSDYQPPSSPTAAATATAGQSDSTTTASSAPDVAATTPTASSNVATTTVTVATPTASSSAAITASVTTPSDTSTTPATATTVDSGSNTSTSTVSATQPSDVPTAVPSSSVTSTLAVTITAPSVVTSSSTTAASTVSTASAAMSSPNTPNVTTLTSQYAAAPSTDTEYW